MKNRYFRTIPHLDGIVHENSQKKLFNGFLFVLLALEEIIKRATSEPQTFVEFRQKQEYHDARRCVCNCTGLKLDNNEIDFLVRKCFAYRKMYGRKMKYTSFEYVYGGHKNLPSNMVAIHCFHTMILTCPVKA